MTFAIHLQCAQNPLTTAYKTSVQKSFASDLKHSCSRFSFQHLSLSPFHVFRTEGCGEWNCQRARNRGVLRQAKRFLYNTQAGIVQAHWEGRAPGPELRGDSAWSPRPGRRLLISGCLHILSQAVFKDSSSHLWQITVTGKYYSTSPEEKNLLVDIRNY